MYCLGTPRYLASDSILVRVWGGPQYDSLAVGEARVRIPDGIEYRSGDTLRGVQISPYSRRPPSDRRWTVAIRPERTGRFELEGRLRIAWRDSNRVDETEFVLPLEVRADSSRALAPRTVRYESTWKGRRFRYADGYFIPIDSSEALLESEIDPKPRVLSSHRAALPAGVAAPNEGIPFRVVIAAGGRLVSSEPVEDRGGSPESRLVEAARRSLERWTFAPARAHGRPVADYAIVRVRFVSATPATGPNRRRR